MQAKFTITIAILLLGSSAWAQSRPMANLGVTTEARLQPENRADQAPELRAPSDTRLIYHHGGYGAPTFGFTSIDGKLAPTFGMRGAWRINRQLGIGLAGTGLEVRDFGKTGNALDVGYGGLLLEYVVGSNRVVHGMFDLTVGGGFLCENGARRNCDHNPQGFFLAEPTANLEFNVVSFMRIDAGAGYRFAVTKERDDLGSRESSGFVGRIALDFGRF